jgi:hypothetical protein
LSQPPDGNLLRAFDEARFGPARTLDLRREFGAAELGPTDQSSGAERAASTRRGAADAARRAEAWLRERQVTTPGEDVLVITGRGKGSTDGVPVIREAIVRLFPVLRRHGVILEAREHTAGAFIVRLASLRDLVDAPRRNRRRTPAPRPRDPSVLEGLDSDTRLALQRLAEFALDAFGVSRKTPSFVGDEMVRQFTRLVGSIAEGPDREVRLRAAIDAALSEYE